MIYDESEFNIFIKFFLFYFCFVFHDLVSGSMLTHRLFLS